MSEFDEKGVSNNPIYRLISNGLDAIPCFKNSSLRAKIHGAYHGYVFIRKAMRGNFEGAAAERRRAREQFNKIRERSRSK